MRILLPILITIVILSGCSYKPDEDEVEYMTTEIAVKSFETGFFKGLRYDGTQPDNWKEIAEKESQKYRNIIKGAK